MTLNLCDPRPADYDGWLVLWQGFQHYYDVALTDQITAQTWARILAPDHPLSMRLAEMNGQLVGFAIHNTHASSWSLTDDCYLEDLFVDQAARGHGVGKALIKDLAAIARTRGCARLYWMTDASNGGARALYDQFTESDGHVRYRMVL